MIYYHRISYHNLIDLNSNLIRYYIYTTNRFYILATILSILHNYFGSPTKLFSNLYLAKFFNTSIKPILSM